VESSGAALQVVEIATHIAHNHAMFEIAFDHPSYTASVLARQGVSRSMRGLARSAGAHDHEDTRSSSKGD
jgi:hypothetical protein